MSFAIVQSPSIEFDSYQFGTPPPALEPRNVFSVLMFCKTVFNVTQFIPLTSTSFISLLTWNVQFVIYYQDIPRI
jgi:hypothetical protein